MKDMGGGGKTSTVNNKDVTTLFSPRTDPCHFWYISELVLRCSLQCAGHGVCNHGSACHGHLSNCENMQYLD